MLQQTQVSRVIDFYKKFIKIFPSLSVLARARWPKILSVVRGMGYYQRFRNMKRTAKILLREFDGRFPEDFGKLRKLPGIGEYTANAILAFAYGKHVPVIDTNVRKVLQTLFRGKRSFPHKENLKKFALEFCPKDKPRDFFQALMDYATLRLQKENNRSRNNLHLKNPNIPFIRVAAGIIHQDGKILIQKRRKPKHLAGYFEFPGGKIEDGEDARACLKREIKEELGIEVAVRPPFLTSDYKYKDRNIRISFHRCSILLGKPKARENQEFRWASPGEFHLFRFPPADRSAIIYLKNKFDRK